MVDSRAWGRARKLGAVHEASRIGCRVVGTEHLLVATLTDPSVRWAFRTVGVDVPEVQAEATKLADKCRPQKRSDLPITADAADAVMQTNSDVLDADEPSAADIARVLQQVARRFLSRNKQSDARDILDTLGVLHHRTRVLATIEYNARRGQPRPSSMALPNNVAPGRGFAPRVVGPDPDPGPTAG